MFKTILDDLNTFLTNPIRGNMDMVSVFLATGLVIVFVILWSRMISHFAD